MSWLKNRAQDKAFMWMFYWGMQSQDSKSEEEGSVRQRRVDHSCTGHSFKRKYSWKFAHTRCLQIGHKEPLHVEGVHCGKETKWIYLLVPSLWLSSVKICPIFVVLLDTFGHLMGNSYPMLRSPEPLWVCKSCHGFCYGGHDGGHASLQSSPGRRRLQQCSVERQWWQ